MPLPDSAPLTDLLHQWAAGDEQAFKKLVPRVYAELRRLAAGQLHNERVDHTLQPTALVNEAFLRLVDLKLPWQDRVHFRAMAATVMRRVLVDYARGRHRQKRQADIADVDVSDLRVAADEQDSLVLELHEALENLGKEHSRPAKCLELHYFGGLSYEEIARATDASPSTVGRDIRVGKVWIRRFLDKDRHG